MKSTRRVLAFTALGLALACGGPNSSSVDDRAAIDSGHDAFLAAMQANDVAALVTVIADDAVFTPPNVTIGTGKEAFRTWYTQLLTEFQTSAVSVSDRDVILAGDWAIEYGKFDWTVTPVGGGSPMQDQGNFVAIWHRQPDGSWKVSRNIWNSSRPLAGGAPAPE